LPSAKRISFLIELSKEKEKKYFFSIYLRVKKKDVLLHPLIEREAHKKEWHVHRHIELTAVLIEISEQIKESKRIDRFETA
jgi:hypothetical protein